MHPLDIISESPNLFIFQKESNKTNLGGFVFLIYLIIIVLIFIYYLIDYIEGDKYNIQSFSHFNLRSNDEVKRRNENINYNPNINFKLELRDISFKSLDNKYKLYSNNNHSLLNRNTTFKERVSKFNIYILYECENENCLDYRMNRFYGFYIGLEYDGFYLDHQNKYKPIIKREDNESLIIKDYFYWNYSMKTDIHYKWRNILYTEKKYFKNDYRDSCGYIENYVVNPDSYGYPIFHHNFKTYLILCSFDFSNRNIFYTEYIRKRISEFDILANILSLISNLYFCARMILKYYSKNFNNYKIIEKLLQHNIKIKPDTSCLLKEDKMEENHENNKKDIFANNIDDNNLIQDINDSEKDDDSLIESNVKLKKFHFYEFFLNNLYCCFQKKIRQKFIHKCNKIVYKYASIVLIIKNQILFENFMKDYKWNDTELNNIENNDLFIKLKTYL